MLLSDNTDAKGLSLDRISKQVYWVGYNGIFSCSYDGLNKKTLTNGSFNRHMLAIFDDLVYFQNSGLYINQKNMSSGDISAIIEVENDCIELVVVHDSLQPMGKSQVGIFFCTKLGPRVETRNFSLTSVICSCVHAKIDKFYSLI